MASPMPRRRCSLVEKYVVMISKALQKFVKMTRAAIAALRRSLQCSSVFVLKQ